MAIQMKFIAPLLAARAAAAATAAAPAAFAADHQTCNERLGDRLPVARQRSVQCTFATRPISPLRRSGLPPLPPLVGVACTDITFTTSDLQRRRY